MVSRAWSSRELPYMKCSNAPDLWIGTYVMNACMKISLSYANFAYLGDLINLQTDLINLQTQAPEYHDVAVCQQGKQQVDQDYLE